MAKVNGPLFSFGARGQLGRSLVFFPWKGIDAVRSYAIPSNPRSAAQTTQRGYLSAAVSAIHAAMADATKPLIDGDKSAYSLWASKVKASTTWFNQATKNYIDVCLLGNTPTVFRGGVATPGSTQVAFEIYSDQIDLTDITAATVFYGTSPTALINSIAATITGGSNKADKTITSLTAGVKYYFQLRVDVGENCEGAESGIYYATPTA